MRVKVLDYRRETSHISYHGNVEKFFIVDILIDNEPYTIITYTLHPLEIRERVLFLQELKQKEQEQERIKKETITRLNSYLFSYD